MPTSRSIFREYFEALLIAVIFATFARTYAVQAFKIPTGSMEENLLIGDHNLVNKFIPTQTVRRGDVVVFRFPEDPSRDFIKRCIGLPGDTVEIVNKEIRVNGEFVEDGHYTYHSDSHVYPHSVFLHESYRDRDNFGPFEVPVDHYFFMGDNRDNSNDSRFWGAVPGDYIKGRAFLVYWSFASDEEPVDWPGYRGKLRQLSDVFLKFFTNTRWERSFRVVR
jgi:signal peptidase I